MRQVPREVSKQVEYTEYDEIPRVITEQEEYEVEVPFTVSR